MNVYDPRAFLTPKHFSSSIEIAGSRYEIELDTPDLSDCPRSVWGDWGPMYEIEPESPSGVHLRYRSAARSVAGEREIDAPVVRLSSPMWGSQRQLTPYYLEIEDAALGLSFSGYLDPLGKPVALEVKTLRREAEISGLLSGELPLQDTWYSGPAHLRVA